jgi:hypothetical protein
MAKYVAFYGPKTIEVEASSSYAAQKEAARLLKVPDKKRPDITVILNIRDDGTQVTHSTASI